MRVIARKNLDDFARNHPDAAVALSVWRMRVRFANWKTMSDIQSDMPKAKVLNAERVRFEIQGGDFRLIAAFDFQHKIAFIKFVGTHAEYDRIDALTVTRF